MNVLKIKSIVMKRIFSLTVICLSLSTYVKAQDSTATVSTDSTATEEVPKHKYARAVFNSTRIINMQSTEIVSKGALEFMINHHFSYIWNKGAGKQNIGQLFGLNSGVAHTYLSFAYSPLSWLNTGIAAAGSSKYEAWLKFRILRQQTGVKNIPVSVSWFSLGAVNTASDPAVDFSANRFSFVNQLLIARKISSKLSVELVPTWVHFNIVPYGINNSNEVFSLGMGARYRLKPKLNVSLEYSRQLNMYENLITKNGTILNYHPDLLAAGIEVNTGGHLFQFFIGNTIDASNVDHFARNNSSIKDGNFAFGFTINRTLALKK